MEATAKQKSIVTIISDPAETVYVHHPEYSYGIFCFNSKGDLFLNSDWGMYGYAWRHYGQVPFKKFLSGTNAEYIFNKFSINAQEVRGKKLPKHIKEPVTALIKAFIEHLRG